ncbi:PAS domain S-box protein [bacterium]|nr:PAS domain S-box protein [bacterium]MBU1884011.1 PAS domain S-box protein [bacterium]
MEQEQAAQNEIARLNKIIQVLMDRAERSDSLEGSDYSLFQTTITLEDKVQQRTHELEASLRQNENITRALRESENRTRLLIQSSPIGIYEIDIQGKIVSMNPAGLLMHGFQEESEVKGLQYLDIVREIDRNRVAELLTTSFTGISSNFKYRSFKLDKIFQSYFVPIKNSDEPIEIVMGIAEDITEQKKSEERLKKNNEMLIMQSRQAAMGDMVSMIAHQWRQPISIIGMIVNALKMDIELEEEISNETLSNSCEDVEKQIQYLSKTIDDFRNFLDPQIHKESVSVCTVLQNSLAIIGKTLENSDIDIAVECQSQTQINIVANELMHVVLNIINNAQFILVERKIENARITISGSENEESIVIEICDNGGGIDKEIIAKLGEPYVSSKSFNNTGLGVFMSKMILNKHMNGDLQWMNKGQGACFSITIKK